MTLVRDIVRDAYRACNLIAISADPLTAEYDEGLRLLNRIVSSSYGNEASEQLDPLPLGQNNISKPNGFPWYNQSPGWADWFVPHNTRLVCNLTDALTVYLDPNPEDGSRFAVQDMSNNFSTNPLTVVGNGHQIDGNTSVSFNTNGTNNEYFFRQDTGNWALLSPLGLDDTFPFPTDFDDFFVLSLAIRINPSYSQTVDPQTLKSFTRAATQFKARYRQHDFVWSELGLIRTSGARRRYYDDTRFANSQFVTGWAIPYGGYRW